MDFWPSSFTHHHCSSVSAYALFQLSFRLLKKTFPQIHHSIQLMTTHNINVIWSTSSENVLHSIRRTFVRFPQAPVIVTRSVSSNAALNLQKGFIFHRGLLSYWYKQNSGWVFLISKKEKKIGLWFPGKDLLLRLMKVSSQICLRPAQPWEQYFTVLLYWRTIHGKTF